MICDGIVVFLKDENYYLYMYKFMVVLILENKVIFIEFLGFLVKIFLLEF